MRRKVCFKLVGKWSNKDVQQLVYIVNFVQKFTRGSVFLAN